jgi:hypothetical protein
MKRYIERGLPHVLKHLSYPYKRLYSEVSEVPALQGICIGGNVPPKAGESPEGGGVGATGFT